MEETSISERMRIREKQADTTNDADSPFITMDRRVWLDYADEVAELEDELKQLKEDCKPFQAQIDQRKTYTITTPQQKSGNF